MDWQVEQTKWIKLVVKSSELQQLSMAGPDCWPSPLHGPAVMLPKEDLCLNSAWLIKNWLVSSGIVLCPVSTSCSFSVLLWKLLSKIWIGLWQLFAWKLPFPTDWILPAWRWCGKVPQIMTQPQALSGVHFTLSKHTPTLQPHGARCPLNSRVGSYFCDCDHVVAFLWHVLCIFSNSPVLTFLWNLTDVHPLQSFPRLLHSHIFSMSSWYHLYCDFVCLFIIHFLNICILKVLHPSPDKETFQSFNILTHHQHAEDSPYIVKELKYLSRGYSVELMASFLEVNLDN